MVARRKQRRQSPPPRGSGTHAAVSRRPRRRLRIGAAALALVGFAGTGVFYLTKSGATPRSETAPPAAGRPNVLLISIDTLRPEHLGCYGYPRPTSPHIDRLAAEGACFEQHISSTS